MLHVLRGLAEVVLHLVFDNEGFGGFSARDALVEICCDLRVDLAHAAIEHRQLLLEEGGN